MNKTDFEKLLSRRAESIYQESKMTLLRELGAYFGDRYPYMNAHDNGNSLKVEIDSMVNKRIEERKSEVISKIKDIELTRILHSLDSVKFLFQEDKDIIGGGDAQA